MQAVEVEASAAQSMTLGQLMSRVKPPEGKALQAAALSPVTQTYVGGDNFILRTGGAAVPRHFSTDGLLYEGARIVLDEEAGSVWVVHENVKEADEAGAALTRTKTEVQGKEYSHSSNPADQHTKMLMTISPSSAVPFVPQLHGELLAVTAEPETVDATPAAAGGAAFRFRKGTHEMFVKTLTGKTVTVLYLIPQDQAPSTFTTTNPPLVALLVRFIDDAAQAIPWVHRCAAVCAHYSTIVTIQS